MFVMQLGLRQNIHWCDCGGRAVFLDIEADRYFCLPAALNGAFLRVATREARLGDAERLHRLVDRGILIQRGEQAPPLPAAINELPTCEYLSEPLPRAGPRHIARALASELHAGWLLRTRPLARVLKAAESVSWKAPPAGRSLERSLHAIVAAAGAAALLTRSHNRCLVRALAVHAVCRSKGIRPKLVFGVIAHPFAAHCWVQYGSAVLVGGFEQARLYTPILVLQ